MVLANNSYARGWSRPTTRPTLLWSCGAKGNFHGQKRYRGCRSLHYPGCRGLLVLRYSAYVGDEQYTTAPSGNDASRHTTGNTTSSSLEVSPGHKPGLIRSGTATARPLPPGQHQFRAPNEARTRVKACVRFVPTMATCSMPVPDTYMQLALDRNTLSP